MKERDVEKERKIADYWQEARIFQKSIQQRQEAPSFVFYEGPPTANGMPHAGHALGRTIKDFVARYKTMTGHQVLRKAGWDTHGLPVELEVQKKLQLHSKEDIEAFGVEAFIAECKKSVFTYEKEWRQFTELLGYWVDMDNPYITLDNEYIESVWHILSHIHQGGRLYKGHRVVPYCPHCETSLSSHEVAQGYKDVHDLSATVKFKVAENEYLLCWTTTPWTLPGNVAVAVNPKLRYVKVEQNNERLIVAESLVSTVLKEGYKVIESVRGEELIGMKYVAPFSFVPLNKGHMVIAADFVKDDSGTGLVHIAPAHGEDDYQAVKENGLDFLQVVNEKGRYVQQVAPLANKRVKESDVTIIQMLAQQNLLYSKRKYEHSYPYCWRCDNPLIYYAMEGWFIRTTDVKEKMIDNNQMVEWYPTHMKNGRFGHFLDQLVDWNIGRNRFWGTPLNVWTCQTCGLEIAPGSMAQLKERAIEKVNDRIDLHKPYVDRIHLRCSCGGEMKREKEVIDVWFDSGSMPYAQYHYPFEQTTPFKEQFPADIVIEGVDQTRGWFYSLLAVSTLYKGVAPYKNVLSLGHILDEQGQKMSKSKGNALNPTSLIEEFGADALRWALLSDSAPWNNKRFSKKTVQQAKSKIVDTLRNVFSFYDMYAKIDGFDFRQHRVKEFALIDQWILSRLHHTIAEVREGLERYDFFKSARLLAEFLDDVSNWYVRRSRQRFWKEGLDHDKRAAYTTLYEVLLQSTRLFAPFMPFVTDEIHLQLVGSSVHLTDYPKQEKKKTNIQLESEMKAIRQIVELTRSIRMSANIKTKQPLQTLIVSAVNGKVNLSSYEQIIKDETNVKDIVYEKYVNNFMMIELKVNYAIAGKKFGKRVKMIEQVIKGLTAHEKDRLLTDGIVNIEKDGEMLFLENEDVLVEKKAKHPYRFAEGKDCTVLLDIGLTEELLQEGLVREVIREVQNTRKKKGLAVELRIHLTMFGNERVLSVLEKFSALLQESLLVQTITLAEVEEMTNLDVDGETIKIKIDH
ncbi:isoleucine--tRNA ligase [Cytobacillus kochii]|uniref:isoleucine--tRNA ligase n=1 Tax=Cytobacillus kochii TaxID=859143 RepID=UPI00203B65E1|nr:isoleucine--tRNA ligase [Cytobacillus kochii]MCM3321071.1 isoleucine--tRNA ligase [Cytobacillus kochii]MCM3344096.1 isoleucine--tRNA ligase [Cytobacillus kochii]MDM5207942.1 isoleucine--tRNA ligase [Cytobacillus kochii]